MQTAHTEIQRAVITGIGALTPIGNNAQSFFDSLCSGRSGIRRIIKFDTSSFPAQIGGELDLTAMNAVPFENEAEMPTTAKWTLLAARQALADADLSVEKYGAHDIDVVLGVSHPPIEEIAQETLTNGNGWCEAKRGTTVLANSSAAAIQLSLSLGIQGEISNVSTACCSSSSAIGQAMRLIKSGESDCVITGGADEGVSPLFYGSFGASLSQRTSDPESASRPFDRGRDGAVFSDAACVIVLESLSSARKRGAQIYCELAGFGASTYAPSIFKHTQSEEHGARAIEKALRHGECHPDSVDYYCALGISHSWLDVRETRTVKRVFKERARKLPVSSIKSMIGHPLGASGAMQVATCALAIKHGRIPPTINYHDPDPECDLDYVPNQRRDARVRSAVTYSLTQGGLNCSHVLKAC